MRQAPVLLTGRLRLRVPVIGDVPDSLGLWTDPQVVRHITGQPQTHEDVWTRIIRYIGMWPALGMGYWRIETRVDGAFVGEAGITNFGRMIEPPTGDTPEAGWALLPRWHGTGMALEAMTAILDWADQVLEAPETCCIIDPGNAASIKLAGKLGYLFETEARYRGAVTNRYRRMRQS